MCLVNDRDIPRNIAKLLHKVFTARELIHARDQVRVLREYVVPLCVIDHLATKYIETQTELLRQLLAPLIY